MVEPRRRRDSQKKINCVIAVGLHDSYVDAGKENLEKAGANDNMHGHPQKIHHNWNHNETTTNTNNSSQKTYQNTYD